MRLRTGLPRHGVYNPRNPYVRVTRMREVRVTSFERFEAMDGEVRIIAKLSEELGWNDVEPVAPGAPLDADRRNEG